MAKCCAAGSTVTLHIAEEDAENFGIPSHSRRKRLLTPVQLFSKQYYDTLVKPAVDAKLSALAEERDVTRGERLSIRKIATELAWSNASEEVKAEIHKLDQCQKDAKDSEGGDGDEKGDDDEGDDEDEKSVRQQTPKDQYLTGKELEK